MPGSSIFDGGVASDAVESMLFGGLSSVGGRPFNSNVFGPDSYLDGFDYSLLSLGNSWSPLDSTYSRFLDSSPFSLGFGLGVWDWGGDFGMNYYLLASSRPYYNPFPSVFYEAFQFDPYNPNFLSQDYEPADLDFSSVQMPQQTTSHTSSTNGGHSGGTKKTAKQPLKLDIPDESDIPSGAKTFIDKMNRASDPSKPDKPRVAWQFADLNGKGYTVLELKYSGLTQRSIDKAKSKEIIKEIKQVLKDNGNVIFRIGSSLIGSGEEIRGITSSTYTADEFNEGIFKSSLKGAMSQGQPGEITGETDVQFGSYAFQRGDGFKVNTGSHYFIDASQEEGERRIRELTKDGAKEEAWVYAEYRDKDGKFRKRWFECGEEEKESSVKLAKSFLKTMISEGQGLMNVSFYHQHSDGFGYDVPSDTDMDSAADLLRDPDFSEEIFERDVRVVTAEGVYRLSVPAGATADKLKAGITAYKKALESRDGTSTFTKEAHDVGFNNLFLYWGSDESAVIQPAQPPAPMPQPAPQTAPAPAATPPAAHTGHPAPTGRAKEVIDAMRQGVDAISGKPRSDAKERSIPPARPRRAPVPPHAPLAPVPIAAKERSVPQLIRQFIARSGGDGTDPAKPKINVKYDDRDGGYVLNISYDSVSDKGKITSSAVTRFLDEAKKKFKDRNVIIAIDGKKFYFDKAASRDALTPEKFAKLAGGTVPKPTPAPQPAPEAKPEPAPVSEPVAQPTPPPAVPPPPPAATDSGAITFGGITFKPAEGFDVNTSKEHYSVDTDIETGKRAIAKLVTKDKEELLAYVEYKDKDGTLKKKWLECGIDEQSGSVRPEKGFIRSLISDLDPENIVKMAFGHPHPLFNEKGEKCGFNPPSRGDMMRALEIVREMSGTGIEFSFFVTDAAGIYTFTPTKELLAELDLNSSSFSLGSGIGPVSDERWNALAESKVAHYDRLTDRLINSDPEEIRDAMETVGFRASTFEYVSPAVKKLVEIYKELRTRHVNIRNDISQAMFDSSKDRYERDIMQLLGGFTKEERERYEVIITDIRRNASKILGKDIQIAYAAD